MDTPSYGYQRSTDEWIFQNVQFPANEIVVTHWLMYPDEPHSFISCPRLVAQKKPERVLNGFESNLRQLFGQYNATRMLGIILSYAAHPTLLSAFGGTPGLWIHGPKGSGKSTLARWLCSLWDMKSYAIGLECSTPTGLRRFMGQYSCLPVILDNYSADLPKLPSALKKKSDHRSRQRPDNSRIQFQDVIIRCCYDRSTITQPASTLTTMPIVVGESPSHDAATRSRFIHIDLERKLERPAGYASMIGRTSSLLPTAIIHALMKNRRQFAQSLVDTVKKHMVLCADQISDREKYVNAVAESTLACARECIEIPF